MAGNCECGQLLVHPIPEEEALDGEEAPPEPVGASGNRHVVVLEEVGSLSERLRQQATDGRSDTLELAKRVNDFQARIRAMTKKMMATVSELSMYQVKSRQFLCVLMAARD